MKLKQGSAQNPKRPRIWVCVACHRPGWCLAVYKHDPPAKLNFYCSKCLWEKSNGEIKWCHSCGGFIKPDDLVEHENLHADKATLFIRLVALGIISAIGLICCLVPLVLALYSGWLQFHNIGALIAIVCVDVALLLAIPRNWRDRLIGDPARVVWMDKLMDRLAARIERRLNKKQKDNK